MVNSTRDKVKGTPFKSVRDWEGARDKIRLQLWLEAERAQIFAQEVLSHPSMASLNKIFTTPWKGYMEPSAEEFVKFYLNAEGAPCFSISKDARDFDRTQRFVEEVVSAGFNVFTNRWMEFMKLKGLPTLPEKV